MSINFLLLLFSSLLVLVHSLGSEDRLFRKYAYLKIYESCFGQEVTKMIRKEVKFATAKCAAAEFPTPPPPPRTTTTTTSSPPIMNDSQEPGNHIFTQPQASDIDKLHEVIIAYRPPSYPPPSFRPYPGSGVQGIYPPYGNHIAFQPNPMFYNPGFQQVPQYPGYSFPIAQQPFFNTRVSRDMEFHSQDTLSKLGPKTRNITCVMQELGYLDHNLEPNYEKIGERVSNLPISQTLKADVLDGLSYCQQFAQCLPDVSKKSHFSSEFLRPTLFFKCYKHKKLEACISNEIREKLENDEDYNDDLELRRRSKAARLPGDNMSDLTSSMVGYWFADDKGEDIDAIL